MIPRKYALAGVYLCAGFLLAMVLTVLIDVDIARESQFLIAMVVAVLGCAVCVTSFRRTQAQGVLVGHTGLLNLRSYRWPRHHFYGGPEKWFKEYFKPTSNHQERIELVAIKLPNGNVYAVERPGRHPHILHMLHEQGVPSFLGQEEQGFVTNHGRYVNRQEAVIIASSQGQLIRKTSPVNQLFSEDLWVTPPAFYAPTLSEKETDYSWQRHNILKTLPAIDDLQLRSPTIADLLEEGHTFDTLEAMSTKERNALIYRRWPEALQ